jgi:hypothetical protein
VPNKTPSNPQNKPQKPKEIPQEKSKNVAPKDTNLKSQTQATPTKINPVKTTNEEKPKVQTGNTSKPESKPNNGNKSQDSDV